MTTQILNIESALRHAGYGLEGEVCPKCGSSDVEWLHHEPTCAAPECDYKRCDACDHQWEHA